MGRKPVQADSDAADSTNSAAMLDFASGPWMTACAAIAYDLE